MQHSVLSSTIRELHSAIQDPIVYANSLQDAEHAVSQTS